MRRVFINLVKNAIEAMPNGGKLSISNKQTNGHLQFKLSDTGNGIPKELIPTLFSPLVTTKAQGMGFGLAICKRIIDAHGGTISAKTAQGKGTTFIITLPLNPPKYR